MFIAKAVEETEKHIYVTYLHILLLLLLQSLCSFLIWLNSYCGYWWRSLWLELNDILALSKVLQLAVHESLIQVKNESKFLSLIERVIIK